MNYPLLNKAAYENLAEEYEGRAQAVFDVTNRAVNYFANYITPGGSVLDIGCAVGVAISILSRKGFKVTGIEISPRMTKFARKRNPGVKIIVGDFLKTKFNKKLDAILAFAFIHLFPKSEAIKVLKRIQSILKPGGVALLSSTKSKVSKEGWEVKKDFNRKVRRFRKFWTEKEFREFLTDNGFKILAVKKYTDPFEKTWMDFVVQRHS